MTNAVLDASAILAVLNAETGAEMVVAALDDAVVSAVNYAEVVTRSRRMSSRIVWRADGRTASGAGPELRGTEITLSLRPR